MRRLLHLFLIFVWGVGRFCVCLAWAAGIALAMIGSLAVSDALQPPKLPAVRPLYPPESPSHFADSSRPTREQLLGMTNTQRWGELQKALPYLDRVCPEIADWTRKKWESGQLVFETANKGRYAYYMPALGMLGINLYAFELSDAELACTLAHEFRHSRQNVFPGIQVAVAALFGINRKDLVEREAYEFEDVIRRAIRGHR